MTERTQVGTVIEDKYRLDEQIGRGSMGAVYRGTQLMVDRTVAIKLLHPTYAGHEQIQARFEVEAKAIARLNHPNCITLFDFGYSPALEAFYTVVEFIDGLSLAHLVEQRPPMTRVVAVIKQIASALGHAHHHGILHRDLKPENIMIAPMTDGSDIIKVLDFGIAQIMKGSTDADDDEFEADRLTRVGEVFGTPPYMSPEQATSSRDLTPASDLYSLGVIFYELVEGQLPFFADAPGDLLHLHRTEPPPPMKRPHLADSVRSVILQMLAKDPDQRPDSGDAIVDLLAAIPDEDLEEAGPTGSVDDGPRPAASTWTSTPPDISGPQGLAPGEASEIYELTEIVAGAQALQQQQLQQQQLQQQQLQQQQERSPSPSSPTPARVEIDDGLIPTAPSSPIAPPPASKPTERKPIASTRFVTDEAGALQSDATKLNQGHTKNIAVVVLGLLLVIGLLSWIVIAYEPFRVAEEDQLRQVSDIATQHHGVNGDEIADDH